MTRTLRPGPASSPSARLSSAPISRSKPTRPARAGQAPHLLHQSLSDRQHALRTLRGPCSAGVPVRKDMSGSPDRPGTAWLQPARAPPLPRTPRRAAAPASPYHRLRMSALPAAANRHVGRRARGSECATPCQHTTAEATSGRADDVHALAQQQAVHVDGPGGAVIRQDVGQLAGALHHVRKRRPARRARRAPLCPGCTLRARQAGAAYQRVQLCWPVRSRRPQVCSM